MESPLPIRSPSELKRAPTEGLQRVGGRVITERPRLILGDALAVIEAEVATLPDPAPRSGDLLVVEGTLERGGSVLKEARVVEVLHQRRTPSSSEAARLWRGLGERLELRARVLAGVRRFFSGRGYLEVQTPVLVPSPGLDLHLDAFEVPEGRYLITSPEYQMKRLLAGGLPRIYQLTPCFRRGERGARHNPEFTMLEWYRAFAGYEVLMNETEALVRQLLKAHVREGAAGIDWHKPFLRLTVCEAFEAHAATPRARVLELARDDEEQYFRLLVDKVEPGLAQLGRPTFLYDFPASQASLARKKPGDPEVCERFELYYGDIELCNGFGELTDPDEQRARLEADRARRAREGKPVYPLDERFLNALAEGMPPAAGNALGFDRLVAICAGADDLAEVMSFADAEL